MFLTRGCLVVLTIFYALTILRAISNRGWFDSRGGSLSLYSMRLARREAKNECKWVLVNIQQAEVFASHTLNRDVPPCRSAPSCESRARAEVLGRYGPVVRSWRLRPGWGRRTLQAPPPPSARPGRRPSDVSAAPRARSGVPADPVPTPCFVESGKLGGAGAPAGCR